MCGIAGRCHGAKNSWQLKAMLEALQHRGPKSFGS
jgi:asparagine synthetase B (glutamine-hydrolysing)